jgi:biopolymer transport protein ExbD
VQVTTPASVIEVKIPDNNLLTILVKNDGRTYLNFDKPSIKEEVLKHVGVEFSHKQITSFKNQAIIGVPFNELSAFLDMPMLEQDAYLKTTGIPTDSTNNQLKQWLQYAVMVYGRPENFKIAVKADRSTEYPKVNNVISTLQDLKLNRFNLITTLKGMPDGF